MICLITIEEVEGQEISFKAIGSPRTLFNQYKKLYPTANSIGVELVGE